MSHVGVQGLLVRDGSSQNQENHVVLVESPPEKKKKTFAGFQKDEALGLAPPQEGFEGVKEDMSHSLNS